MKHRVIFLLCLMAIANLSVAETITGSVVGITDGDTITFLDEEHTQYKIRLSGIDAPEKKQPYGNVAKKTLSECAYGKIAQIESTKTDRYGRKVGKVIVNGTDCNLRQIELGMAWHYKKYIKEQPVADRQVYASAQIKAMVDHIGLWADVDAEPPWEFRKPR